MARVRKPNPRAMPMYPTSGKIHIFGRMEYYAIRIFERKRRAVEVVHREQNKGGSVPRFGGKSSAKDLRSRHKKFQEDDDDIGHVNLEKSYELTSPSFLNPAF